MPQLPRFFTFAKLRRVIGRERKMTIWPRPFSAPEVTATRIPVAVALEAPRPPRPTAGLMLLLGLIVGLFCLDLQSLLAFVPFDLHRQISLAEFGSVIGPASEHCVFGLHLRSGEGQLWALSHSQRKHTSLQNLEVSRTDVHNAES
jgi:hypothetical protein